MTINVSPQIEATLFDFAQQEGVDPVVLIEKMVREYRPTAGAALNPSVQPKFTAENDPLVARLEARIAAAPTDPDAIREAEEDLYDLMRNMNANRAATCGSLPFPDIK
jgi:hypothetical protein